VSAIGTERIHGAAAAMPTSEPHIASVPNASSVPNTSTTQPKTRVICPPTFDG
jgi:hypothetical protein